MRGFGRVAAALPLLCALGAGARAETVEAGWDSYFYAGPRYTARVLDEVQRRAPLDVGACADGWCRVRYGEAWGYVSAEVVRGPSDSLDRAKVAADPTCFHAAQPGGAAWQDERFCHAK